MSLTHTSAQALLISGRTLAAEEQVLLDDHLRGCPECRAFAALHLKMSEQIPAAYAPLRHPPRMIREKARLVQAKAARRRRLQRVFQHAFSLAGAGAALLLFLVILRLIPGLAAGGQQPFALPQSPAAEMGAAQPLLTAAAALPSSAAPAPTEPSDPSASPASTAAPVITQTVRVGEPSPTRLARAELERIPALAAAGQTVYLGDGSRLAAVDVSQPTAPQLLAQSAELPGEVLKVIKLPDAPSPRIAASAGRYLAVFDTATPGALGLLTQSKLPGTITALIHEIGPNRIYAGGVLHGDSSRGFIAVLDTTQPDVLHLLDTIELPAPVQSLALFDTTLYAALTGDAPGVIALSIWREQFGEPVTAIAKLPAASMTAVQGMLYIGSSGKLLAYQLSDPVQPQFAWEVSRAGEVAVPGMILGFVLSPQWIYTAGLDSAGQPFRLAIPLEEPLQTGSIVDTASHLAVANGRLVVAGSPLEIYDLLDPTGLKRLGTYPAGQP